MGKVSNEKLASMFSNGETFGQGSNMFINDNVIYSYGLHYKLAIRLTFSQKISTGYGYVCNLKKYSNSTSKQSFLVKSHIRDYIEIPDCNIEEKFLKSYLETLQAEVDIEKAKLAKKIKNPKASRYITLQNKIAVMMQRVTKVKNFIYSLYGGVAVDFIKQAA